MCVLNMLSLHTIIIVNTPGFALTGNQYGQFLIKIGGRNRTFGHNV